MKRIAFSLVLIVVAALAGVAQTLSGRLNKRIDWELRDSVLYISGSGAMPSYTPTSLQSIPWTDEKVARKIAKVVVGEGITEVGNYSFGYLSEVVNSIHMKGFGIKSASIKYPNLRYVSLPSSLQRIGRNAFSKTLLRSVELPEGLKEIGFGAFSNTDLRAVKLPSGLKNLGGEAFSGCNNLQAADLNYAAIGLSAGLFFDCDKLRMILHTGNVKSIKPSTFNATIFAQFPTEELLNMFHTDGIENYLKINMDGDIPEGATEEQVAAIRQMLTDEFYVKEAKNATVIFNLDEIFPGDYKPETGVQTLHSTLHGSFIMKLTPEQAKFLADNWSTLREEIKPTFRPSNGRVELQFISLKIKNESVIGSIL